MTILQLTVGKLRRKPGQKDILVAYQGSTVHWPEESFDKYDWYRVKLQFLKNMARPKVTHYSIIPRRETTALRP